MSNSAIKKLRPFIEICGLAVMMAIAPKISAQIPTNQTANNRDVSLRSVPSGSKMKLQGVGISRYADPFTIRDRTRTDYQVRINDNTSVKTYGGFLHSGKKYPVTDILRGLIVEVEGRGDAQGQLVAEKIRFNESDMRAAITSDTRVTPVEENQQRIAGQMDELYAIASQASHQFTALNKRLSPPVNYT